MKYLKNIPLLFVFMFSKLLFAQDDNDFSLEHDQNVKTISNEKSLNLGGRIMFDNAYFFESDFLRTSFIEEQSTSGNQFRRLFLYAAGALYTNIEYKLQVNLVNGKVGLRDAFIGFKNIPVVGKLRLGQVKEPIRLSVLNSSNYLTFMERSFLTDFLPIRNSGLLMMNDYFNNKIAYQLGFFRNSDKYTGNDKVSDDSFVVTGRLTGMSIYHQDEFLHIGIAGSYRKYDEDAYNVDAKPEANLSAISYVALNGVTDVENVNIYNAEVAYGYKALNLQGEYMFINVNRQRFSNQFSTFYGQVSWFLTGEHKDIKDSYSGFKRIKPKHNLSVSKRGAWEVALRYSYVDMNDKVVMGGIQKDITFGVNWYLNPYTRFMFNQVYTDVLDKGKMYVSQVRVQIDF